MTLITFTDYTPIPRFDNTPWTEALIQESVAEAGPWTLIDTIVLNPVDSDPRNPLTRNFTTDNATLDAGWYRIVWTDGANQIGTDPIANVPAADWIPSLGDVGEIVLARTRDTVGNLLGTFNENTNPTAEQVRRLIDRAVMDLKQKIGTEVPADLEDAAGRTAALRTAMLIELTLFPNEVAQNRSPYPEYKALYDEQLPILMNAIAAEESGADPKDELSGAGGAAVYAFPPADNLMARPM